MECWDSAGASDVGLVRQLNEDSFLDRPDLGLWVVADGMGGHSCGDVASQKVCTALDKLPYFDSLSATVDFLEESVIEVNQELIDLANVNQAGSIIGSTVVALVARGHHGICMWAGDSRLYLLRDRILKRLSVDHSLVEEAGGSDGDFAASHSNIITRAVGSDARLVLDMDAFSLIQGDRFLLCSDGLSKELDDIEIARNLMTGNAQFASAALVENAVRAGGTDNITVIVADYGPGRSK